MNTHSFIPHRMFVAAAAGHHATAPSGPPIRILIESDAPAHADSLETKRRREAVSAIALRQVFELGAHYGA